MKIRAFIIETLSNYGKLNFFPPILKTTTIIKFPYNLHDPLMNYLFLLSLLQMSCQHNLDDKDYLMYFTFYAVILKIY